MSAYLVKPEHIRQLVYWAKQPCRHLNRYNIYTKRVLPETTFKMAQCLAMANIFSVKARYGDKDYNDDVCMEYLTDVTLYLDKYKLDHKLTAADIYNMCRCLSYQCCEVDDWLQTDAYWLISHIESEAARIMASNAKQKWEYDPKAEPVVDYDNYGMLVQ